MGDFKNSLLIVVFNYADSVKNRDFIRKLYENHFKQVIFYSDLGDSQENDVNYVPIVRGWHGAKVFNHLFENYRELIEESDGVFYTMDDCIINLNQLATYENDRIIFNYTGPVNKKAEEAKQDGWIWWHEDSVGIARLVEMEKDPRFSGLEITGYASSLADSFYIPKRYWTNRLYSLFTLFNQYEVFLEITVPTVINHIEPNESEIQVNRLKFLWDDRYRLQNRDEFYEIFSQDFLSIHPVKLNHNYQAKEWMADIFGLEVHSTFKGFDWGNTGDWFKKTMSEEFGNITYETVFKVKDGDVVVDVGASIGPFIRTILDRKFEKCYAVEPSKSYHDLILKNTDDRVVVIDAGISSQGEEVPGWDGSTSRGITFQELISEIGVDRIDFLKVDCEGGEYEIFDPKNLDWLKANCRYSVGEWHLDRDELKQKFRFVRDNVFRHFKNVIAKSVDGVDITWDLYNDHFIEYYTEAIIHIEI